MQEVVTTELEVRWGECDPAGIVYHPSYIDWFSVARMRFMKENGVSYMETFHDAGIVLVVLEVHCKYKKTLKAEDRVFIEARLVLRTRTRLALEYVVKDTEGTLCAEGRTEHAFVDMSTNRACSVEKKSPRLWDMLLSLPKSEQ